MINSILGIIFVVIFVLFLLVTIMCCLIISKEDIRPEEDDKNETKNR